MRMNARGNDGIQPSQAKGESPSPGFAGRSVAPKRGRLFLRETNRIGRRRALLRRVSDVRSDD